MENDTLTCTRCELVKPVSEFGTAKHFKRGYKYYCKICANKLKREYHQRYMEKEYGKRFSVYPKKLVCRTCGATFSSRMGAKRHFIKKHLTYEN